MTLAYIDTETTGLDPRIHQPWVQRCRDAGYEIPDPDHTAEGDVRATRAAYEALREIGRQR